MIALEEKHEKIEHKVKFTLTLWVIPDEPKQTGPAFIHLRDGGS